MPLRALSVLAIVTAGALAAGACSGDDRPTAPTGAATGAAAVPSTQAPIPDGDPPRQLKVAIVRDGDPADVFSTLGATGLRAAAAADGHVELADVAGPRADELPVVLQKLCDDRYDLVIGHGASFAAPITAVAATCPGTAFLTTDGTAAGHPPTANVDDWSLSAADVGYPLGVLAARAAPDGAAIAILGPAPADATEAAVVAAFRQGVAEGDPTATFVDVPLTGADAAAAAAAAATAAARGAKLVLCPVQRCALVATAAEAAGLPVVTGLARQVTAAPTSALAATPLDLAGLYRDAFHLVRQQRWGQVTFTSSVEDGQVDVVVNPAARAAASAVPIAELARTAEQLVTDLRSGARKIPAPPEPAGRP